MSAFDKLTYNPPNEQTRAKLELKIITDTSPLLQSKIINIDYTSTTFGMSMLFLSTIF